MIRKVFKLVIVGNSVSLRNRPHKRDYKNYGQIMADFLERDGYIPHVENLSFSRATIIDFDERRHQVVNKFPHCYIVHLGVCDAATREIPLWYSNYINSYGRSPLKLLLKWWYVTVITKYRPFFVRLRGKKPFVSIIKFEKVFSNFIDFILANSDARVIIAGITAADARVERELPGSAKNYIEYNKVLKRIAESRGLSYIDLENIDHSHYPDGTHFSQSGNLLAAERIMEVLRKDCYEK